MTAQTFFLYAFGGLTIAYMGFALFIFAAPLWQPLERRYRRWRRDRANRDKRLSDYDIHEEGLMMPMLDGFISEDIYWDSLNPAQMCPSLGERLLKRTMRSINKRYCAEGATNAYERGLRYLEMFAKKPHYYMLDAELQEMVEEAMRLRKGLCFKCRGRGYYWEPHGPYAAMERKCGCSGSTDG